MEVKKDGAGHVGAMDRFLPRGIPREAVRPSHLPPAEGLFAESWPRVHNPLAILQLQCQLHIALV